MSRKLFVCGAGKKLSSDVECVLSFILKALLSDKNFSGHKVGESNLGVLVAVHIGTIRPGIKENSGWDGQITRDDLQAAQAAVGEFGGDNRAGIEGTLHRISAIRSRKGQVVGLTCRVGRAVTGHIDMVRDVLHSGQSILFLGRLRDVLLKCVLPQRHICLYLVL